MNLKKFLGLSACVCGILFLNMNKVKADQEYDLKYKNNLINSIKNESNLNNEKFELTVPCFGIITSRYGYREIDSATASKNHKGIDIGASEGTSIFASHTGIVTKSKNQGNYGKCIIIENEDYKTIYAHCSKLLVDEGEKVIQGQKIAEVGKTGNATGNHLHFEIIINGQNINPEDVIEW